MNGLHTLDQDGNNYCCPKSCGKCGGDSCDYGPAGEEQCCLTQILASGKKCSDGLETGCFF